MSVGHFIADRLHVSATNREVIRTARNVLARQHRTGPDYRDKRHELYRLALEAHRENRELYRAVMYP
jgi:hypothetical protein